MNRDNRDTLKKLSEFMRDNHIKIESHGDMYGLDTSVLVYIKGELVMENKKVSHRDIVNLLLEQQQ